MGQKREFAHASSNGHNAQPFVGFQSRTLGDPAVPNTVVDGARPLQVWFSHLCVVRLERKQSDTGLPKPLPLVCGMAFRRTSDRRAPVLSSSYLRLPIA